MFEEGGWDIYRFYPWLFPALIAVVLLTGIILTKPNIFKPTKMRNQKKQNKKRLRYIEDQKKKADALITLPSQNFTLQRELVLYEFDIGDEVLIKIGDEDDYVWVPAIVIEKEENGT